MLLSLELNPAFHETTKFGTESTTARAAVTTHLRKLISEVYRKHRRAERVVKRGL